MTSPDCPNPNTCPVPDPQATHLRDLKTTSIEPAEWFSVFSKAHEASLFNDSGRGDARFSPLLTESGDPIPTLYTGRTKTAALLETVFHEVTASGLAKISRPIDLARRGLRTLEIQTSLSVVDLRDEALARIGIRRDQLVATTAAHYVCTRDWAMRIREAKRTPPIDGIIWKSRLTEIAAARSDLLDDLTRISATEVMVLFGDRAGSAKLTGQVLYSNLNEAEGLINSVAHELGAVIVSA